MNKPVRKVVPLQREERGMMTAEERARRVARNIVKGEGPPRSDVGVVLAVLLAVVFVALLGILLGSAEGAESSECWEAAVAGESDTVQFPGRRGECERVRVFAIGQACEAHKGEDRADCYERMPAMIQCRPCKGPRMPSGPKVPS